MFNFHWNTQLDLDNLHAQNYKKKKTKQKPKLLQSLPNGMAENSNWVSKQINPTADPSLTKKKSLFLDISLREPVLS